MRDVLVEYGAILLGLLTGTFAHFGRILADGEMPTFREAIGYILQLGMIGLVAVVATRELGLENDDIRALATAVLAVSTQEVIRYLREQGWRLYVPQGLPDNNRRDDRRDDRR